MILKTNCTHYVGDRPCKFSKESGIKCSHCDYFSTEDMHIIIVKLDALGDVLRTTSLLTSLRKKYPNSHITWVTSKTAEPIFHNNNAVDEVMSYDDVTTVWKIQNVRYNLLINPDASPLSSAIATNLIAEKKLGYLLDNNGKVIPANEEAEVWLEMGVFDEYKKANSLTYQEHIHHIAKLPYERSEVLLYLSEAEMKYAKSFYQLKNLKRYRKIIGVNTGAGEKWPLKQWTEEGFVELLAELTNNNDIGILLYGGPRERYKNKALSKRFPSAIDTGFNNTLRQFFALMSLSDIVLTGDTLALHVATALKKKVVCYFGPTSANEIEDYGLVTKIQPNMDCLTCYKRQCDFKPNCMESISCSMIYQELKKLI